jgi:hypothetical protein
MEHIVLPSQYTYLNLVVEPNGHMFGMSMFLLLKRCSGLGVLHLKLRERKVCYKIKENIYVLFKLSVFRHNIYPS